jgi:hypothetical protein
VPQRLHQVMHCTEGHRRTPAAHRHQPHVIYRNAVRRPGRAARPSLAFAALVLPARRKCRERRRPPWMAEVRATQEQLPDAQERPGRRLSGLQCIYADQEA